MSAPNQKDIIRPIESKTSHAWQYEEVMGELDELRKNARIVTTPEELEALEREIRELTDRLASLLLEQKLQVSLDSAELEQGEKNW